MHTSVKTTHVIPSALPPVRAGKVATLLICPYCVTAIGAYSSMAEKLRIEKRHVCPDQVALGRPAASVPFN
jgi:hypothetical protein